MRLRLLPVILFGIALLVLGFVLGERFGKPSSPREHLPGAVSAATATRSAGSNAAPAREFQWAQVESSDYAGYIAKLRRAGCPEQTIRDIIVADICNLYSQEWKRKHLAAKPHYWDPEYGMGPIQSEEIQSAAAELQTVLRQNVRQLLGVDLDKELEKYRAIETTQLGDEFLLGDFLPPEKASAVSAVLERHRASRQSVESNGFLTAEGVVELKRSRENLRRELAALLRPEEVAQVEYRCSEAAQEIRDKMTGFDLSENEFKELLARRARGQEGFEAAVEQGSSGRPPSPDEILKLAADNELSATAIKEVLGPERYAEYQRSRDPRYQQLEDVAVQSRLSPDWARTLYDHQRAVEENARVIRENPNLSTEEKEALMRDARRRSQEQLRLWLGEELARKLQPVLTTPP